MRRRVWALYYDKNFSGQELHIVKDSTTPLYKFDTIEHCLGVYRTPAEALARASLILKARIRNAKRNLERLEILTKKEGA